MRQFLPFIPIALLSACGGTSLEPVIVTPSLIDPVSRAESVTFENNAEAVTINNDLLALGIDRTPTDQLPISGTASYDGVLQISYGQLSGAPATEGFGAVSLDVTFDDDGGEISGFATNFVSGEDDVAGSLTIASITGVPAFDRLAADGRVLAANVSGSLTPPDGEVRTYDVDVTGSPLGENAERISLGNDDAVLSLRGVTQETRFGIRAIQSQ